LWLAVANCFLRNANVRVPALELSVVTCGLCKLNFKKCVFYEQKHKKKHTTIDGLILAVRTVSVVVAEMGSDEAKFALGVLAVSGGAEKGGLAFVAVKFVAAVLAIRVAIAPAVLWDDDVL